jgi:SAM-dependent methyltransferase
VSDLLRLPIDQYQRYRLVADVADRLRRGDRPLSVLDIGGRTGLLCRFLPRDRVVRVDRESSDQRRGLVLGDGARLPFRARSFDLVCAFDTLEHVPPADREAFVRECARVSSAHVVLIGPYASSRVRQAEHRLREFLSHKLDLRHRYLDEHASHGLPSRRTVRGWFEDGGAQVAEVGQGNLQRWLGLMCLELYFEEDPDLRAFAPGFYEFYNGGLYSTDNRAPVYRHALVATLPGARPPDLEGLFAESSAPPELFTALERFSPDLAVFDRAREQWREERRLFERTVAELRADLEGHRRLVPVLQQELEAQRGESSKVSSLRQDELADRDAVLRRAAELDAHSASLRARIAQLEGERESLTHDRGRLQGERDAALSDRDGHRQTLDQLRAERDELRAEREALTLRYGAQLAEAERLRREAAQHAAHLEASLAAERARGAALGGGLDRERLTVLEAQLAAQRAVQEALLRERELLARGQGQAALERDQGREHAAALEQQLRGLREELAAAQAAAAAERQALGDLLEERTRELRRTEAELADLRARLAEHALEPAVTPGPGPEESAAEGAGEVLTPAPPGAAVRRPVGPYPRLAPGAVDLRENRARHRRRGRRD